MGCCQPLSVWDWAAIGAELESGLCQARIARMLGTSVRSSQGVCPRCRPCSAGPCLVRPRGVRAPLDQRAPQGPERVAGWGAMCWLPSSRWAYDQPRGDLHVDPHAIAEEEPRRSTGSCCPCGVGRARGPPPAGCEPPIVGMRLIGRAP